MNLIEQRGYSTRLLRCVARAHVQDRELCHGLLVGVCKVNGKAAELNARAGMCSSSRSSPRLNFQRAAAAVVISVVGDAGGSSRNAHAQPHIPYSSSQTHQSPSRIFVHSVSCGALTGPKAQSEVSVRTPRRHPWPSLLSCCTAETRRVVCDQGAAHRLWRHCSSPFSGHLRGGLCT